MADTNASPPPANESFWNKKRRPETGTKTRVFISHSSDPDEYADAVRTKIADELEARGFEVLLDERLLRAGDPWRSKIYRWLGICDAAVVLLNQAVVDRAKWVRFEAQTLGWRYETGDLRRIVPVLLPDFAFDDLAKIGLGKDGPVPIPEIQIAQFHAGEKKYKSVLVKRALAGFDGLEASRDLVGAGASAPVKAWVKRVRSQLHGNDFLPEAAVALGIEKAELPKDADVCEELVAYRLLHSDLAQAEDAIVQLGLTGEKARILASLIIPSWLPAEAVRFLAQGRAAKRLSKVAAVTVESDLTARDFVLRATCCNPLHFIVPAMSDKVVAEKSLLGMGHWYRATILKKLGADEQLGAEDIKAGEAELSKRGRSVFVILGRDALNSGVAPELMDEFGGSVFVLNADDQTLADARVSTLVKYRCEIDIDLAQQRAARRAARRLLPEEIFD